ncbi:MAG TPA: hypothetical protein PLV42_10020 [bacterium]|nr:hypothetical protein [bacterium]
MKNDALEITCSLGEFLTREARERRITGILFTEDPLPLYLHLRDGLIINIESWDPVFSLAAFTVSTGLLSIEEYRAVRTVQRETYDRFSDILRAQTTVDLALLQRLYESFAFITLLRLIRQNGEFTVTEGAVNADPVLIEAINPERFADRLTKLFEEEKTARILDLWEGHIEVDDPACGFENGPVATGFVRSPLRFREHLEKLETALAAGSIRTVRASTMPPLAAAAVVVLLFAALFGAIIFLAALSQQDSRKDQDIAEHQITLVREKTGEAMKRQSDALRIQH